jgi:hypothetical protein
LHHTVSGWHADAHARSCRGIAPSDDSWDTDAVAKPAHKGQLLDGTPGIA